MKIHLKLRKGGRTKKECLETIANVVNRYFRLKERNNEVGMRNPISYHDLIRLIEKTVIECKFLKPSDKMHHHYEPFLDRLYRTIMFRYIRKNDTNQKTKNPYYLPELVYIDGLGYVIVNNKKAINIYQEERNDKLNAQLKNLENRIFDAKLYLKDQLESGGNKDLLDREVT